MQGAKAQSNENNEDLRETLPENVFQQTNNPSG